MNASTSEAGWRAFPLARDYNDAEVLRKFQDGEPLDAEEYLVAVRALSRQVPDVMVPPASLARGADPSAYWDRITALPRGRGVAARPGPGAADAGDASGARAAAAEDVGDERGHPVGSSSSSSAGRPCPFWEAEVVDAFARTRQQVAYWETAKAPHSSSSSSRPPPSVLEASTWRRYALGPHFAAASGMPEEGSTSAANGPAAGVAPPSSVQVWYASDEDEEGQGEEGEEEGGNDDDDFDDDDDDNAASASASVGGSGVKRKRGADDDDGGGDGAAAETETAAASSPSSSGVAAPPAPPLVSAVLHYDAVAVIRLISRLLRHHRGVFERGPFGGRETTGPSSSPSDAARGSRRTSLRIGADGAIELTSREAIVRGTIVASVATAEAGHGGGRREGPHAGGPGAVAGPGAGAAAPTSSLLSVAEAAWVYALLTRLDTPLHGDTAACVRSLFLLLRRQRDALVSVGARPVPAAAAGEEEEGEGKGVETAAGAAEQGLLDAHLAAINVLLAVTGRFFSQRLAEEV
jgi:hypothetical protein